MVYIIEIKYRADIEKVENPDIRSYIKEVFARICKSYGFEGEPDAFSLSGTGEIVLIERESEIPLQLPFEYVEHRKTGDTELFDAGYIRNNEEIISYIIPFEILDDEIKTFLEDET